MVEFSGEEGVDAGALKNDFYEECLRQADKQFFQGKEEIAMLLLGHRNRDGNAASNGCPFNTLEGSRIQMYPSSPS